jgi:hypothetical protein
MRLILTLGFLLYATVPIRAADDCMTIHGRASLTGGDLQLRIWQIGTHHEFEPDDSSWDAVVDWLNAGVPKKDREAYFVPASTVYLFADFLICPTEPFQKGSVQQARVKSAVHRHYVNVNSVKRHTE